MDESANSRADADTVMAEAIDESLIDPANSERKIYREPNTGIQREIWRPGKLPQQTLCFKYALNLSRGRGRQCRH